MRTTMGRAGMGLIGLPFVIAFVFGSGPLVGSVSTQDVRAGEREGDVVISVDGVSPADRVLSIPVGGEQDFTALRLRDGRVSHLLPEGEVRWSLAADGAASLNVSPGDFVVGVTAEAPGNGALYVSAQDGQVGLLQLVFYDLGNAAEGESTTSSVSVTSPADGSRVLFQQGAHGIPLPLTASVDNPGEVNQVEYKLDEWAVGSSQTPPYAVSYLDLTNLTTGTGHRVSAKASPASSPGSILADAAAFEVVQVDADSNSDGLPDDPFALGLGLRDVWRAHGVGRDGSPLLLDPKSVAIAGLSGPAKPGQPSLEVSVTVQDPENPTRVVTLSAPGGLLESGETGVLILMAARTLDALGGSAQSPPPLPPLDGVAQSSFVYAGVLVSADGGQTFSEMEEERLALHPLTLLMQGVAVLPRDNARVFGYPAAIVDEAAGPGVDVHLIPSVGGEWVATDRGGSIDEARVSAFLTSSSIFAPFETPDNIRITALWNEKTGKPTGFSRGGDRLLITLENVPPNVSPIVTIDGAPAAVQGSRSDTPGLYTVLTPRAARLGHPSASNTVDVRVTLDTDPLNGDTLARGFTYTGPAIDKLKPGSGTEAGGTAILVEGDGFDDQGMSANLGGAAVIRLSHLTTTSFGGVTTSHTPGPVDIEVRTANGYVSTSPAAYVYTAAAPVVTGVQPSRVFTDGGYTVRVAGAFFDPDTGASTASEIAGYFARVPAFPDPSRDIRAADAILRDDANIDLVTPAVDAPLSTAVYVVSKVKGREDANLSNAKPFSFVSPDGPNAFRIASISPGGGPVSGGDVVEIRLAEFRLTEGGPDPLVWFGPKSAEVEGVVARENVGSVSVFAVAPPGERAGSVDVRVADAAHTERFAVSRAGSGGYAYKADGAPLITCIEPNAAWLFGGRVVRIEGVDFDPDPLARTRVLFGGVEAGYPPDGDGFPQSSTELHVIVPPLEAEPGDDPTQTKVDIAVVNPDGTSSERSNFFTYVRLDTRSQSVAGSPTSGSLTHEGVVTSTALFFNAAEGSGTQMIAVGGQGLATPPEEAILTIPPMPETSGRVFVLARTTREFRLFGLENIEAGRPVPGQPAFDVHLYQGEYPFEELDARFDLREAPATLELQTTGASDPGPLAAETVRGGGVTLYGARSRLDYRDLDHADHALVTDSAGNTLVDYEWNVGAGDVVPEPLSASSRGAVERVLVRLAGSGSFALCSDAYVTDAVAKSNRYALASDSPNHGPYAGGTEVIIEGRGLAWPERILFGGVVAYQRGTSLEDRLVYASDTELRVLTPAVTEKEGDTVVDIVISLPQGEGSATRDIRLAKQFTFDQSGTILLGILAALLGIPIALIGLFAGGKSGGGSGGPCFIATAAYGTPLAEQIDVLRAVRDTFLLDNALGSAFVDTYYRLSPPVADVIAGSPVLAMIVRVLLRPVIALSRVALAMPQTSMVLSVMLLGLALVRPRRVSRRRT